jgi:predicted nuclease with TOPRIM domain
MEGVKIIAVAYDRDPGGSMGGLVIAQKTDARIYNGMELVNRLDFDRVSAENLALQQRLTVQDQRVDELEGLLERLTKEVMGMAEHIRAFDEYGDFEHELNALSGLLEKSKRCVK